MPTTLLNHAHKLLCTLLQTEISELAFPSGKVQTNGACLCAVPFVYAHSSSWQANHKAELVPSRSIRMDFVLFSTCVILDKLPNLFVTLYLHL